MVKSNYFIVKTHWTGKKTLYYISMLKIFIKNKLLVLYIFITKNAANN